MGIEARLIFMNGVVVTPQLSLLDQWLSAFTKINTCPYNCTVKQISIFHNMLKHIHVFCTYIIFMQRFAAFYCTLQEENIHASAGRVFIIPNKLQVLKIFCKELWIQRLKTVSKIYHFVSLHQQSIGIVFCWADDHELVEGLFCDGLLYKAASKIIFFLSFLSSNKESTSIICCKKLALTDVWFETFLELLLKISKKYFVVIWPDQQKIWLFFFLQKLHCQIWFEALLKNHHTTLFEHC